MALALSSAALTAAAAATLPTPDHVVVVIEENKAYSQIIGNTVGAPYINSLAQSGALMSNSFGTNGASQPNYLQLFSGSDQGVTDNTVPQAFNTPQLSSALAAAGLTFGGYSESLPAVGYTGGSFSTVGGQNQYVRKHNPWINWLGAASNALPLAQAQPFSSFPSDFSTLPTVSFVVPNEQNNMHDGSIAAGDTWLQTHLGAYASWAQTHNSLLIVTWDEDNGSSGNHIATLFIGPMVVAGVYAEPINHLNVLSTIEAFYGLGYVGNAAASSVISDIFVTSAVPEPAAASLWLVGLLAIGGAVSRRRRPSGGATGVVAAGAQ